MSDKSLVLYAKKQLYLTHDWIATGEYFIAVVEKSVIRKMRGIIFYCHWCCMNFVVHWIDLSILKFWGGRDVYAKRVIFVISATPNWIQSSVYRHIFNEHNWNCAKCWWMYSRELEFVNEMNSQTKLISMNCPLQLALHKMHTHTTIGLFEVKTMAMTLCDANRDSIFPSFFLLNHLT